jgi:hypothetical protein
MKTASARWQMLRDPLDDHGRLDPTRIVGKVRQLSIDDLEALAAEVLGAEVVEQRPEPRRVDETADREAAHAGTSRRSRSRFTSASSSS